MMRVVMILTTLAMASLALVACAHTKGAARLDPWEPADSDAARVAQPLAELQAGLAIYRSHCGGCHMLFPADSQPAEQWPKWVKEMSERSKLTPAEEQTLTHYLVALARRPTQNSSPSPSHP